MDESVKLGEDGTVHVAGEVLDAEGKSAVVWLAERQGRFPLSLVGTVSSQGQEAAIEIALGPDCIAALKAYFFDH